MLEAAHGSQNAVAEGSQNTSVKGSLIQGRLTYPNPKSVSKGNYVVL